MIYVKESIQSKQIEIPGNSLECVAVKIILSPEMLFVVITLYRPPTAKDIFVDHLAVVLKMYGSKELILIDKTRRKKLT